MFLNIDFYIKTRAERNPSNSACMTKSSFVTEKNV